MRDSHEVYRQETARRAVRITVTDGTLLEGSLLVPKTRGIGELLNGTRPFLDFELAHGGRLYIAKTSIRSVQAVDLPKATGLRDAAA